MITITQKEYLGEHITDWICPISTIDIYKEKIVNRYRICLVKKTNHFGVDIFFKNGKLNDFLDRDNFEDAEKLYNNGLIKKYREI